MLLSIKLYRYTVSHNIRFTCLSSSTTTPLFPPRALRLACLVDRHRLVHGVPRGDGRAQQRERRLRELLAGGGAVDVAGVLRGGEPQCLVPRVFGDDDGLGGLVVVAAAGGGIVVVCVWDGVVGL